MLSVRHPSGEAARASCRRLWDQVVLPKHGSCQPRWRSHYAVAPNWDVPDPSDSLSEEEKKKPTKTRYPSASKLSKSSKSTSRKCGPDKDHSDDYKASRHDKQMRGLKMLEPLNTPFLEALDYKNYRLVKQSQKYYEQILKTITKWSKRMDVQKTSAIINPSDLILILSHLQNYKTVGDWNGILNGPAMRLFQHFMKKPAKAALAHWLCATENGDPQQ